MPPIGRLDKRVSIERLTRTADGAGGYTETWNPVAPNPRWAAIEPATARAVERLIGARVQTQFSHLVTIRWQSGLTSKDRVTVGTRIFFIRGLHNPDERNEWWVLACEELEI